MHYQPSPCAAPLLRPALSATPIALAAAAMVLALATPALHAQPTAAPTAAGEGKTYEEFLAGMAKGRIPLGRMGKADAQRHQAEGKQRWGATGKTTDKKHGPTLCIALAQGKMDQTPHCAGI